MTIRNALCTMRLLYSVKFFLYTGLSDQGVRPEDIEYVVCPTSHVENLGNLNLFPNATHIVGYDIMRGDQYILHDFSQVSIMSDNLT